MAQGVGNPIIAVGARTGRDGIHGASFASEDLSEASDAKRPRVQVGDPFTEKLLLEASLELIDSGHIVAIQDMGAAGLTSSSAEMAARGDVGVDDRHARRCPAREEGMTPYEMLLSESQERMLVVAKRGHEDEVRAILEKWDLTAAVIGEVIAEPVYRVTEGDRVVAEFPGIRLVTDCPTYDARGARERRHRALARARRAPRSPSGRRRAIRLWTLEQLLASPTIASKRVGVPAVRSHRAHEHRRSAPAATRRSCAFAAPNARIALKTDCNGRYVVSRSARRRAHRRRRGGAQRRVHRRRGRWRSRTTSTSAIRSGPRSTSSCAKRSPEWARRATRSARRSPAATSRCTTRIRRAPCIRRRSIGMVGLVESLAHVTRSHFPATDGDAIVLLGEQHRRARRQRVSRAHSRRRRRRAAALRSRRASAR